MRVYVQAFEGDNKHPSFLIDFDDLEDAMNDGVAIHAIGHEAARNQNGWSEDRITAARWVVIRPEKTQA